jgi:hypothetical protein
VIDAADKLDTLYATSASLSLFLLEKAEYHSYAALSRAAWCEPVGPEPYAKPREALGRHERQLRAWAANCPQNFKDRAAAVGVRLPVSRDARSMPWTSTSAPSRQHAQTVLPSARLRAGCPLLLGAWFRGSRSSLPGKCTRPKNVAFAWRVRTRQMHRTACNPTVKQPALLQILDEKRQLAEWRHRRRKNPGRDIFAGLHVALVDLRRHRRVDHHLING